MGRVVLETAIEKMKYQPLAEHHGGYSPMAVSVFKAHLEHRHQAASRYEAGPGHSVKHEGKAPVSLHSSAC